MEDKVGDELETAYFVGMEITTASHLFLVQT
jgi:hypothetical protein